MTDEQVAKEMLKDFIARRPLDRFGYRAGCPFIIKGYQHHELCAILFPGWGRKYLKSMIGKLTRRNCPCMVLSHRYVKRTARRFAKYGYKNKIKKDLTND